MKVVFHPRVFAEIDAIMRYYDDVADAKLAEDFYHEFRSTVIEAATHPERINERVGGFKRVNLKRFPYNFLFREQPDTVRILAVRHHAKHPAYGTRRK